MTTSALSLHTKALWARILVAVVETTLRRNQNLVQRVMFRSVL